MNQREKVENKIFGLKSSCTYKINYRDGHHDPVGNKSLDQSLKNVVLFGRFFADI